MSVNSVVNRYKNLTAEERFRLILAASGRGDESERDRLAGAGRSITLTAPDHAPFARAFDELSLLTYIELVDAAVGYLEAFARMDNDKEFEGDDDRIQKSNTSAEMDSAPDNKEQRPIWQRQLDIALAAGFLLKTKANGWKLFCERLTVPPFFLWEELPGFERLQNALAVADQAAFHPDGMLNWLNGIRPVGHPELSKIPLTAEGVADETERAYRHRVEWWGGTAA
jgi:hypothetical protein